MRACAAAATLLLLMCVGTGRAQTRLSLTPGLSLSAGWDDNLFLDPALTGASSSAPRADAVFDIHPSLEGRAIARGHTFALEADDVERATPSNGELRDLWLHVEWSTPLWHRLRLALTPSYEHYEATRFVDNRFDMGGGEATLRLVLARAWLEAGYRFAARGYGDAARNGQLDVEHGAAASAHVRVHRLLTADVAYRFLHTTSNAPTAALDRHRADLLLALRPTSWLTISAGYGVWGQALPRGATPLNANTPGGARSDVAHAVVASVTARPLRWLELFARYDLLLSTSDSANGRYQRNQVMVGAVVDWTWHRDSGPPPEPLRPSLSGRVVTFRAQAHAGAVVAVVGDWTGWQPLPLAPAGGAGQFEASYALPPGRHVFALSIDGVVRTPPSASAFVDDGFGGKNGVVEVP